MAVLLIVNGQNLFPSLSSMTGLVLVAHTSRVLQRCASFIHPEGLIVHLHHFPVVAGNQ